MRCPSGTCGALQRPVCKIPVKESCQACAIMPARRLPRLIASTLKSAAKNSDHHHACDALISVRCVPKSRAETTTPDPYASGRARKLLLQISTKDKLFADSGRRRSECNPQHSLRAVLDRSELTDLFLRSSPDEERFSAMTASDASTRREKIQKKPSHCRYR